MKKQTLLNALNAVNRAIKPNAGILSNVRLELNANGLIAIGSSQETTIRYAVEDNSSDIGNTESLIIVTNAKLLTDIVNKLSDDVELSVKEGKLLVKSGKSRYKLNVVDATQYPIMEIDAPLEGTTIELANFSEIVNSVAFAAATKNTRPVLTAANLSIENGVLRAVATDSARLSVYEQNVADTSLNVSLNISARTLKDIVSLGGDNVELIFTGKTVAFRFDNLLISTRLIAEEYPNVSRLLTSRYTRTIKIDSDSLAEAIDRMCVFGEEGVLLELTGGRLCLRSSAQQELGDSIEELSDFVADGDTSDFKIGFNGQYLKEAIKVSGLDVVELNFNEPTRPIMFSAGPLTELVTPVRIH